MWRARVECLLVGAADGWRGYANPCAVLGYAVLCYGVGVGVGVMRISGRRFIAFLARCVSKGLKMCGRFGVGVCGVCVNVGEGGVHLGCGGWHVGLLCVAVGINMGLCGRACGCNAVVGP